MMIGNELLTNFGADFKQLCFVSTAWRAHNIKIKRNKKKKGFVGYRKCVQVMNILQVQKMRTTLWKKISFYLFAFFAGTVVLSIPSFFYFVNPFFVGQHSRNQKTIALISVVQRRAGDALVGRRSKSERRPTSGSTANVHQTEPPKR